MEQQLSFGASFVWSITSFLSTITNTTILLTNSIFKDAGGWEIVSRMFSCSSQVTGERRGQLYLRLEALYKHGRNGYQLWCAQSSRVGGDSASSSVADISNTRLDTENSKQGNWTSRAGIPRSEAGARRVRTRADSRTRTDSRQGSVGSLSPGPQARELRGEAVEASSNIPSDDNDEESARASMRRRGVDDDAEIFHTKLHSHNLSMIYSLREAQ